MTEPTEDRSTGAPLALTIGLGLLGALFIASALLKLRDLGAFDARLVSQGLFESRVAAGYASRLLTAFELFLGLACFQRGCRRRIVLPATIVLLAGFTLYLLYLVVAKGDQGNCGCFGEVLPMTPLQSIIKNLVFLAIAIGAYLKLPPDPQGQWRAAAKLGLFSVALVALAFPVRPLATSGHSPFARFAAPDFRLDRGKTLVAFLSTDCDHCQDIAFDIGGLDAEELGIKIFFLLLGEPEDARTFMADSGNEVPFKVVDPTAFFAFVAKAPPTVYRLRDGQEVAKIEGEEAKLEALWPTPEG